MLGYANLSESQILRGVEMLANTSRQCMVQTGIDYAFRHLQPWFKEDLYQSVREEPLHSNLVGRNLGERRGERGDRACRLAAPHPPLA